MTSSKKTKWRLLTGVVLTALVAGGLYYTGDKDAIASPTPAAAPAIPVVVQTLTPQNVRAWSQFSGRLQAVDSAEIKPEVSGRITEVKFEDGQSVKAGDVLFVIDPRPYEANVAKAEAALQSAKTNGDFARLEEVRAQGMLKSQAIAQRLYDERANAARVANAAIQSAEAELKQARLDLDHAYIKAPISGRVSRAELTEGNVVQAGPGAPKLTSIVSDQSLYADFEVDEQTYIKNIRKEASANDQERQIPVRMEIRGDTGHVYNGTIESFDNHIDPTSGTIRARAKFENADGKLIPGMFASISLADSSDQQAVLVPERALGFDQDKKFVYVVGDDNKVAYREVELGQQIGAERVAIKGIEGGERVIVDGLQHVRPDAIVAPTEGGAEAAPAPEAKAEPAPEAAEPEKAAEAAPEPQVEVSASEESESEDAASTGVLTQDEQPTETVLKQ